MCAPRGAVAIAPRRLPTRHPHPWWSPQPAGAVVGVVGAGVGAGGAVVVVAGGAVVVVAGGAVVVVVVVVEGGAVPSWGPRR